jgi:AraC-like DNA-binding protein
MFGQLSLEIIVLLMLYTVGTTVAATACIYLLFRRGNAFAPRIRTPRRLRRWTAVFFGAVALGHLWYLPSVMFTSGDEVMLCMLIGALLDCLVVIPLAIVVMLCMLQDRRRPLWPVGVMISPLVVGVLVCVVTRSDALVPWLRLYFLPLGIGLTVYMVREVRRYGRWLRDNYADLEHKEVWQTFVAMASILLMFGYYVSGDSGMAYEYIIQVCCIALVCFLLWRVETLADLSISQSPSSETISDATYEQIGALLKQQCEDTQLYLQHDLTLSHLAHALGTNRTYLGMYFSRQGTTYNSYINDLRIDCFVRLVREANAAQRPFTAQELAAQSGYRSYRTFSVAFRQRTGQSVTEWMNEEGSA